MAKGDQQIQNQTQQQQGSQTNAFNTNQTQSQTGSTLNKVAPWEQAQPLLQRLLAGYSGLDPSVTSGQSEAISTLKAGAAGVPNFGGDAAGAASKLFGTDTTPQMGLLSKALQDYQANLGATASGANLDPYATPGFSDALNTMSNDITNRVKGVYAGAGRDPSGAGSFAKSLGRGLTEGIAPTIAAQFNQNKANQMKAAGDLFAGTGSTAGQLTQQGQVPLQNAAQAIGLLPQITSAFTAPGTAQLGAANVEQGMPFANLAQLLAPSLQLGGLGSQTTGSTTGATTTAGGGTSSGTSQATGQGTSTTTQPQSLLSNILGGVSGGLGLLSMLGPSGSGAMGGLGALMALSDERAKEDIEPIGKLHDGGNVYRFRYKGEPKMHIGLLAQEVERSSPDAVGEVGGLKMVEYGRATDRAARMGKAA